MSGTIANYVKEYRNFFGYLFTNGLYDLDYQRLKIPRIKYRERRVPTDEEVKKLFQVIDNDEDKLALLLLVDCGLRVTELATIKLKSINLDDASIVINGKGAKIRTVYLSETSVRHIKEYTSKLNGEYLFPVNRSDSNHRHRNRRYFENRLSNYVIKLVLSVSRLISCDTTLLHTPCLVGADVKAVSEMLGHADVGITLKIYHHVNAKAIRDMHREYSPVEGLGRPL
jgi:site-specific recombinase XerD